MKKLMTYIGNQKLVKLIKYGIVLCFLGWIIVGCVDPFTAPSIEGGQGYLVVDGFLNVGQASSTIRLTRTQNLDDSGDPVAVTNAFLSVEEKDGDSYFVDYAADGNYVFTQRFDAGKEYRLRIYLDEQEYVSSYVEALETPEIDSVSWEVSGNDINVQVTTHDPENQTRYYRWDFVETWEYRAPFYSAYTYDDFGIYPRKDDEIIYYCWMTVPSKNILLATSDRLAEDVIFKKTLSKIPSSNIRLRQRYSMLVHQYAMSKAEFEYWDQLSKSTEQLGGLFDPLPSRIQGNISNVADPDEPVLGYFSAYSVTEKRMFINRSEIPSDWRPASGFSGCDDNVLDTLSANEIITDEYKSMLVLQEIFMVGYVVTENTNCADCRSLGGTTVRPDFW